LPATAWQFRATIVAFNAKKVAYQCHPTFIFATTWQIRCHQLKKHPVNLLDCHASWKNGNFLNGGNYITYTI